MTPTPDVPAPAFGLQLHGTPQLWRGPTPVAPGTRKALALVLLLVLEPGVTRTRAASWLWPDLDAAAARRNLRRELHRLRQLGLPLPDAPGEALATPDVQLLQPPHAPAAWLDGLDGLAGPDFDAWLQGARRRLQGQGAEPGLQPPVVAPAAPAASEVDRQLAGVLADPAAVREPLEHAWQAAQARGDAQGAWLLSAVALLAAAADFADFRGLGTWLARFESGEREGREAERTADALRLDAARLALPALDHRFDFRSPALRESARRLFDALLDHRWPAGDEHVLLAKILYDYHGLEYEEAACERLAAMAGPGVRQASPAWQVRWWLPVAVALDFWGHAAAAEQARQTVADLAAAGGGLRVAWGAALMELTRAMAQPDAAAQDRAATQLDALRLQVPPAWLPRGLFLQAQLLLRRGRPAAALEKVQLVLQLCGDFEVPERDRGVYHELAAHALAGLGRWEPALAVLDGMREHQSGSQGDILQGIVLSLQAGRAWALEQADAPERSLALVRHAAPFGWHRFLPYQPARAAQVVDAALRAGVETEFVTATVRERRLRPPEPWRADWPWRLHVRLFGSLNVLRDGQPLQAPGKGARRPRELLCLLAAHAGQALDVQVVIDELWPSLEAEAPRASLDMAVSRLRRWLGVPEAVQVADGRIALDPDRVWTDVGALEPLAARAAAGEPGAWDALRSVYPGPLLDGVALGPRLLARRTALAERYAQAVQRASLGLLACGEWVAAIELAQGALQADPLCEPLHRVLIQAQLARGERALARRSYERCRELLRSRLGVDPSPATESLLHGATG